MQADLEDAVGDLAFNDRDLPAAHVSDTARRVENWCKQQFWKLCVVCGTVRTQHPKEVHLRHADDAPSALAKRKNCSKPGR